MRSSLPALTLGTVVGCAAAVALYASIAPTTATDSMSATPPSTTTVRTPTAAPAAIAPQVRRRPAPCTGSSRLEHGVCVVVVERTVTRLVAPPASAPVPESAAPAGLSAPEPAGAASAAPTAGPQDTERESEHESPDGDD